MLNQYQLTDNSSAGGYDSRTKSASSKHKSDKKGWNWEFKFTDKLFLFSFDLIELNTFYNYFIYSLFLILDFLFIAYYPLSQIYNKHTKFVVDLTKSQSQGNVTGETKEMYKKSFDDEQTDSYIKNIVQYFNIDYFLDNVGFEEYLNMCQMVCHGIIAILVLFFIMIATRQLDTINLSSQRKFITKIFAFGIVTLAKTLQFLLLTFLLNVFDCDSGDVSKEQGKILTDYCYSGIHLTTVIYASLVTCLYYSIVIYFHYFLTLSYPHEKLPWACLPTKIPILIEINKFLIVFVYQETNIADNAISYMNILFTLIWLMVLYKRIMNVLIFHTSVYIITIVGEACMFIIFGFASLRDFISIDRNFVFHILWVCSCIVFSLTALFLREKIRYKFLSKVDFALYEKDFDALIMMFTLHELIERSSYDDKQDFLLRGFIERHIEICEFPTCTCIKYYTICNQQYRLELAQMSPFSKNYDSGSMNQNTNNQTQNMSYSQREQSEGDDLSTLKVFYGRQKNQQKQNKSKGKFLKKFLIDNINVFLEVFPNSVKLHIMAAFIYFSIFKNSFKSLYELSFTKSKKSSLQDKYECFVLSSQIIAYFQSRASQGMSNQPVQFEKSRDDKKIKKGLEFNTSHFEVEQEIKSVIEFEKINIKFQKMIEQTSIQTREFWQEILKKNIDVKKIFELGAKIYKNFIDIKKKYKNLMALNNNYLEVAYLYKLFVSLILNFEIEVEDAKLEIVKIMQSKSMKKHNLKAEYKTIQLLDENGMIIISGNTNNFAKVQAMNNKAERIFGYQTNELISQKLTRLMPKLFVDTHEDLILNFVNGNRKINKENHNFVWGKHKTGFIVPLIMDINAYVNFEFNFCFIAFLKRSILLEFKPMRELLEYQDVFVLQSNQNGVIQDMTQNLQEYLNFPINALQKDISVELLFKGIFDDENEASYQNGKRVDFDPISIRRILESEDIDVKENDSDAGTNFNMSEKKCTAIVWLRMYDYTEQDVKLTYKEIWFVLTEDDASFLDTKNTTEYMTQMDGDAGVKVNVTYTDDREEICSIASVSSLANYDKNRKNIMAKLSEIKTQTIDDSKPRQIDLLQKAIIAVFLSVLSIALILLVVSVDRNNGFFDNVSIIQQSKESTIYFSQIRVMLSTLVAYENSKNNYKNDSVLSNLTGFILQNTRTNIEQLRKIQSYMNFVEFEATDPTYLYKNSYISDFQILRSNKLIETKNVSMMQGIQEILDTTHELTAKQYSNYVFDTNILNYDKQNASNYTGGTISDAGISLYTILKNSLGSLSNYLILMSENYINDTISIANNNSSLVLILTIISITITFLTAFVIMPILHKIERSKEKVLMIYTELKKEQIESLNRNIKVFFMKMQMSSSTVGGSLLYQNSSKQFSGKLVTRKFTSMQSTKKLENDGDFGFLMRKPAMIANEIEPDSGAAVDEKDKNVKSHFPLLFNNQKNANPEITKEGGKGNKKSGVLKLGARQRVGLSQAHSQQSKGEAHYASQEDDISEDEEAREERRQKEKDKDEEELSENAEEDKKAQILMSKEEAENALFKRIFQNKIKQMTCMRQVKYYILVIVISLFMSGYFTLSYFMVTNIFNDSQLSLETFDIVGNRGPYVDSLIAYFLQSYNRNREIYVEPINETSGFYDSIDYYYQLTQENENDYNYLRKTMPSMIEGSNKLIQGLESQDMCSYILSDDNIQNIYSNTTNTTQMLVDCKNVASRILQLGLQQTINNILQNILQGSLQFRQGSKLSPQKEQQLFQIIFIKMKYLNSIDLSLLESVKNSIISYFTSKQRQYVITFSVFVALIIIMMVLLSYMGVDYLFKNLIAIKFILNFIPGQWLIDNNAADDLKYIDF